MHNGDESRNAALNAIIIQIVIQNLFTTTNRSRLTNRETRISSEAKQKHPDYLIDWYTHILK